MGGRNPPIAFGWGACPSGCRVQKGVAPPRHRGWGYVWVTWQLLVFGRVSAASAPGEEVVTTREIVVAVAAAGGREEVGLALRGVWPPCQLPAAAFRRWRSAGGGEPGASGQVLPARLGVSEYLAVQSRKLVLRKTSSLPNQ